MRLLILSISPPQWTRPPVRSFVRSFAGTGSCRRGGNFCVHVPITVVDDDIYHLEYRRTNGSGAEIRHRHKTQSLFYLLENRKMSFMLTAQTSLHSCNTTRKHKTNDPVSGPVIRRSLTFQSAEGAGDRHSITVWISRANGLFRLG